MSGCSRWGCGLTKAPRRPVCAIRWKNPHAYVRANCPGFTNILEGSRHNG